jgi:membrane protein
LEAGGSKLSRPAGRLWEVVRHGTARSWVVAKDYIARVFEKGEDDNIFVLASGLTFSVLTAATPFLLIIVSVISLTLEAAAESAGVAPTEKLRSYLEVLVPVMREVGIERGEPNLPEEAIEFVIRRGERIGWISFIAFVWFSTRLFGALRAVLGEIFDLRQSRGIIQGKIFDAEMVLVSTVLVVLNIGITFLLNIAKTFGLGILGLEPEQLGVVDDISASIAAFTFIFILFLLIYKYVPARRVPWRMALTAAIFTALCWEILKLAFAFYLTRIADYRSVYGGLATLVAVVVWLYYLSVVFILGAEVAQVREMRRVRRHQFEMLE